MYISPSPRPVVIIYGIFKHSCGKLDASPRRIHTRTHAHTHTHTSTMASVTSRRLAMAMGHPLRALRALRAGAHRFQSSAPSITAALLQKNLAQRNHSLYNDGTDTLRCTMLDGQGNVGAPSLEIKREELIAHHGLLPRDLRKIEKSRKKDLVPILLVRENSIFLSLLTIRALVKSDKVILFDSVGLSLESRAHRTFVDDLALRLRNQGGVGMSQDPLPYEFRALESIFVSALSNLVAEMRVHLTLTRGILQDLEYSVTRDKLRFLLVQNKKLSQFYKKASLMGEMIDDLLDQDDVLCDMHLSSKLAGRPRNGSDHAEIEMLLETYYAHVDEVVQTVGNTISDVRTTEEIINIILDSNRNQLMLLGLRFSIGLLSLGGALYMASLYGMNLENYIEEGDSGFFLVTSVCVLSMSAIFLYSIRQLHRLQKVTLSEGRK
ncbi:LADA_0D05050g1_1 [Lachancea dasiensis]|uniref:Magnesium transporter n=1 Tax=Lachancea dasiensis TaxID=1072105 RepID=A0A1G4J5A2_9SACH|nr:LADA_0D05050g1_1 [Lachancea dasiensis]